MQTTTTIEITMTCKPFAGARGTYRLAVDTYGRETVRVWDSVAGHYTVCHRLTGRSIAAARRKARQSECGEPTR